MASRRWVYFGGFVLMVVLALVAGLMGVFEGLSSLSGGVPMSEEILILRLLAAAAKWLLAAVVLAFFALVFLAATVVSALRNGSIPRDDRLVTLVEWLERRYPILRRLEVKDEVEPTTEDRIEELKTAYVAGEISQQEYERRMEATLREESGER